MDLMGKMSMGVLVVCYSTYESSCGGSQINCRVGLVMDA